MAEEGCWKLAESSMEDLLLRCLCSPLEKKRCRWHKEIRLWSFTVAYDLFKIHLVTNASFLKNLTFQHILYFKFFLNFFLTGDVNTRLTQRVPWICAPQASGGLVLGIPSLVTRRLLERNCKNIHQVHEGSLIAQTRKQEYESLYPMLTVLLLGMFSSLTAQIRHDNPARHNNVISRFVNKCCKHEKNQGLKSTFVLSVG